MKVIRTEELTENSLSSSTEKLWVYNGLDCCVTLEVFEAIEPQLDNTSRATYEFSKALQGPILEMNMRGVLIDPDEVRKSLAAYETDIARLISQFNRLVNEGFGLTINPASPAQLKHLFYDVMRLPVVKKRNAQGGYGPSVDRNALEKLSVHFYAQPIIAHILAIRDLQKKISFLRTERDGDGRLRTSFNIAGTTTGRLASALSDFGTGTNLQNIDRRLRRVFIPDPGMKFCNVDLEQADSRNLGAMELTLFGDARYLDACESGDLHTAVCRMAWTELNWTGDPKADRKIADQIAYRDMSYRDLAKRLSHGTNYEGQPATMAMHSKIQVEMVKQFQLRYFAAFPAHQRYHQWIREEIRRTGQLTTLFGRRRYFFGRRDDPTVIREAVAYIPQSMTADEIDHALIRIWRDDIATPLLQVHDSILFQYPAKDEAIIIPEILKRMRVELDLPGGRKFSVPAEAKVGWNWADVEYDDAGNVKGNEYGLVKWRGADNRNAPRPAAISFLDRLLR